jgi:hypothetical protein
VETTSGRPSSPSRAVPWRRRPGSVITGRPGPHLAAAPPVTDAFRQPAITDLRVLLNPGDRRHRRVLAQTVNPGLVFGAPPPARRVRTRRHDRQRAYGRRTSATASRWASSAPAVKAAS